MSLSSPFIQRPVATTLLTLGVALAGIIAFQLLPVAPLPPIEFPAIAVSASMPGASPEVMASSVAATGRRMKIAEKFTPYSPGSGAGLGVRRRYSTMRSNIR